LGGNPLVLAIALEVHSEHYAMLLDHRVYYGFRDRELAILRRIIAEILDLESNLVQRFKFGTLADEEFDEKMGEIYEGSFIYRRYLENAKIMCDQESDVSGVQVPECPVGV